MTARVESKDVMMRIDDVELAGVLDQPAKGDVHVGILLLPGSGPVDRDGNLSGLQCNYLKLLAAGLVQLGYACLRIDKRGIGASRHAMLSESVLRLDTYVDDAIAWLHYLRRQPGISHIAVIGHSEGALIATLAAQQATPDALVLLAGAGRPAGDLLRDQLGAPQIPPELRQLALSLLRRLEVGEDVAEVPAELTALFRPSLQPYLRSWLSRDPVLELKRIKVPVLIVQGQRDLQISETDARLLASAQSAAKLVLIGEMNHVLKSVPASLPANIASYGNPTLPIADGLLSALDDFFTDQSRLRD